MAGNKVILFQNGIGAFERTYEVGPQPTPVNIPVQTNVLADVIGSLRVLDGVKVVEPPSYAPKKEKPALTINPGSATKDMAKALAGAKVSVSLTGSRGEVITGTLVNVETQNNIFKDTLVESNFLIVMAADGSIRRLNLASEVDSFTFTDKDVQEMIQKALTYNLEQTKPNSTFVNLKLAATGSKGQARVRYTVQTPAWKFSYRLTKAGGNWTLTGFAVVDNNTDEDWKDFTLSVATGTPITYDGSDLSEIIIPDRPRVSLVDRKTQGAVFAESGNTEAVSTRSLRSKSYAGAAPAAACAVGFSPAGLECATDSAPGGGSAQWDSATVSDVGDSSIFTAVEPVTIPAHKSAIVKVFDLQLRDADLTLYYNPTESSNVVRAVRLTNEGNFSLGKGACSVEEEGVHQGSTVLSAAKPGQSAILNYAVETGVKVVREVGAATKRTVRHTLTKGVMVSEFSQTQKTSYTFKNVTPNDYKVVFDHTRGIAGSKLASDEAELVDPNLAAGIARFKFDLDGVEGVKETVASTVFVTESKVVSQRLEADGVLDWITRNPESPFLKSAGMKSVAELSGQIEAVNAEIATSTNRLASLNAAQERVRKNLTAVGNATTDGKAWATQLGTNEGEIATLESKTIPALNDRKADLTKRLKATITGLTAEWTA